MTTWLILLLIAGAVLIGLLGLLALGLVIWQSRSTTFENVSRRPGAYRDSRVARDRTDVGDTDTTQEN